MNLILTIQFVAFCLIGILGFFVLSKNPRSEVNRYFCTFAIGTAGWNFSLLMVIGEFGQPLFWGRLAFAMGSFMPLGLFLFAMTFPWKDGSIFIEKIVIWTLGLFFFVIPLTDLMIESVVSVNHTYISGVLLPATYLPYLTYYFGFIFLAFIKLILKHRDSQAFHHKEQLKYIILGVTIFLIPVFLTQLILPLLGIFQYNNLGPLFSLPMITLIGYAIVKHQLMDIRLIIQRGAIYSMLLVSIITIFLTFVYLFGFFFQKATGYATVWSAGITMFIGIFGVPVIERYFRKITDSYFFKDKYDYARVLQDLSEILNRTMDVDKIVSEVTEKLETTYKAKLVSLHLDGDRISSAKTYGGNTGTDDEYQVTLPIMLEQQQLGVIILGEKRSEDPYSVEDIQLLKTFVNQLAVALEKAALYTKVKSYSEELEARVQERTTELVRLRNEEQQMMLDISHGLQTPLTIIKNEIELLKTTNLESAHLGILERSIDNVSKFIYDLFILAKLETRMLT